MSSLKFVFIVSFSLFNLGYLSAQKIQLKTKWQTAKYDSIQNVSNMDFLYSSDDGLLYLITNDEENLYVHLKTLNEISEKKIIQFGFSVEIKVKGDKTKRIVEYPLQLSERVEPVILIQNNSESRRNNFNLIKEQLINQIYNIRLKGFSEEDIILKAAENSYDIFGNIALNTNGQLQYILKIPLQVLEINSADDVLMNIVLESGSLEVPMEFRQNSNVENVGIVNQNPGNRQNVGAQNRGQMPQQGNMRQQQMDLGAYRERGEMEKSINIKLKNILLLKAEE